MKPVQVPAADEIGGCSEQPKSYLEVQNSFEATVEQMQSIFREDAQMDENFNRGRDLRPVVHLCLMTSVTVPSMLYNTNNYSTGMCVGYSKQKGFAAVRNLLHTSTVSYNT